MCLYPILIKNRKYLPNKKNGYNPPIPTDPRVKAVAVGCGRCIECRKQKSREWQVRLNEEIKTDNTGKFVTLTFNEEELNKLIDEFGNDAKKIAIGAVRRFTKRAIKNTGKTIKHWLINELGHKNTERLHLHGLLFTKLKNEEIEKIWSYGNIFVGEYVNAKTINYIIKYVTKIDNDHKEFQSTILCSKGIGKNYLNTWSAKQNRYQGNQTKDNYRLPNGNKVNLPIYYRNKIYTEEQREKLWIELINKNIRYVRGEKINIATKAGQQEYWKALQYQQKKNIELGYGNRDWIKKDYENSLKNIWNKKKN